MQLELFERTQDERLTEIKKEMDAVRRGIFARQGALLRVLASIETRLTALEKPGCRQTAQVYLFQEPESQSL